MTYSETENGYLCVDCAPEDKPPMFEDETFIGDDIDIEWWYDDLTDHYYDEYEGYDDSEEENVED